MGLTPSMHGRVEPVDFVRESKWLVDNLKRLELGTPIYQPPQQQAQQQQGGGGGYGAGAYGGAQQQGSGYGGGMQLLWLVRMAALI